MSMAGPLKSVYRKLIMLFHALQSSVHKASEAERHFELKLILNISMQMFPFEIDS